MSTPLNAINDVQAILGYDFRNPQLLLEALKTAGSGFNLRQGSAGLDGNKRVAQVGSAILKLAILDDWYHSGATRGNADLSPMLHVLKIHQRLPIDWSVELARTHTCVNVGAWQDLSLTS